MNYLKIALPALIIALSFTSCQNSETKESNTTTDTLKAALAPLSLADVTGSPEFPDAQLGIKSVTALKLEGKDSVKISFHFDVKNYELASQTADAGSKLCNNSAKGQHIHFIIDNKPYVALYEPSFDVVVPANTEHYVLAFLSRSYHESIKDKNASVLYHFSVGESGRISKLELPKTPMVFYSRPKGDYLGKDTENLLFDFYLWNTTLTDGNKVMAHIQTPGIDTTMNITEWKSHFLTNMPMGKSSITLTLTDSTGKKIDGPETEVTREFNLARDEPMK